MNKWLPKIQKKITVVGGHSRGGAFSTISSLDLRLKGYPVAVLTAGAPPAGNTAFVREHYKYLGAYSFRHVHGIDAVPHYNVEQEGKDYLHHVPNEIWEFGPNQYKICQVVEAQPWVEDATCSISKAIPYTLAYFTNGSKPPTAASVLSIETESFGSFFSDAAKKVSSVASKVSTVVKQEVKKATDVVKAGVSTVVNKVKDEISSVEDKLTYFKNSLLAHGQYFGYDIKYGEDNLGC